MNTRLVGERLLELCGGAKQNIFIAAPFIKRDSLKRILEVIPATIVNIKIVTRWKPEEIAAGVSDLEIFELLQTRSIDLLLHPALHAKLYRVDDKCLLGSANITDRALGWSWQPNVELMVYALASDENVHDLESTLLANSIRATQAIHDGIKTQVEELMAAHNEFKVFKAEQASAKWVPLCLKPALLYRIYTKADTSTAIQSLVKSGEQDLAHLQPPAGMNETEFKKYIGVYLDQHPVAVQINQLSLNAHLTSEDCIQAIKAYCQPDLILEYDVADHWEVMKSWLMYFFPNKYRVKVIGEVFEQARII